MNTLKIKVMRRQGCEDLPLPQYMSEAASGMDLYAAVDTPVLIERNEIKLVPAGIHIEVPRGYEAQVRPRSGLALKHGLTLVNTPGTIDSDYRGEIGIILCNLGKERFTVERGMRIAQLVIQPVTRAELVEVERLEESPRGTGGFGHTGH
ncbi:MAG: dUTP diphosphatase [Candidatus Brocadia sp.]|jgi:deoxyuridine 5'-triphosphate nucleotidohydrolase (EC 3.6.1.23)|uniref:Deoxyuridine 5'-triphosphate nucleotidohydrolase n=1 Tax=Candidatus Brocadia fulgida TaxID=380242 RepID=A0A0M2UZR5_9BACT|nr:MAG: deoxyuridine 5'-triphosphate nucleotidohydrolase [Candidatus Brocadia fulgida]MCC6325181.1 dUTP diphosphatase [Candidatus Brocadia sp.]MCE7910652.1 dUTP diphosphatase [Candidatus Brocadia sp. AMX3]OQY97927.1 MAG: deoxyuridine 5'-triphosphate nucleotidohydrolase [Candidatus Brocadia sp. UTAMX2]MBV6518886.1 Deoxyuridine 5'-triphosphate nucleotidohydrolase [Candidatus Brocadia fulgida]